MKNDDDQRLNTTTRKAERRLKFTTNDIDVKYHHLKLNTTPVYTHLRNHIAKFLLFLIDHQTARTISVRFCHLSSHNQSISLLAQQHTHMLETISLNSFFYQLNNKTRFSNRCDSDSAISEYLFAIKAKHHLYSHIPLHTCEKPYC